MRTMPARRRERAGDDDGAGRGGSMMPVNARFEEQCALAGFGSDPGPLPMGLYRPFVLSDNHAYLSGVTPRGAARDHPWRGRVPDDLSIGEARQAAHLAALNLIGNLRLACGGDLGLVEQFVMLRGFVLTSGDFAGVPSVIDGASELIIALFGAADRHARTSIGVAALPDSVSVELDAVVRIRC